MGLQDSQLAPLPLGPGPFRGTVALTRSGEQIHAALTFAKEPSVTIFAHSGALGLERQQGGGEDGEDGDGGDGGIKGCSLSFMDKVCKLPDSPTA